MTQTINIPHSNSCNLFPIEEIQWPAFDRNQEYCCEIRKIVAWRVPRSVHQSLGLTDRTDLYLSSEGHWAPTLEIAEHFINNDCPLEFICKRGSLSFFVPPPCLEEYDSIKAYDDCRVFRTADGGWDFKTISVEDSATF
jgi:hypothetical protein